MVQTHQIRLSDYYVKKNNNTIPNSNTIAVNKNLATNSSGNIVFEEKDNHTHNYTTSNDVDTAISVHDSDSSAHDDIRSAIPTDTDDLTNGAGFITSSALPSSHPTTFITNSETYSNIGSNLTNQKLINDALNLKMAQLNSLASNSVSIQVIPDFDITDIEAYTDENITDSLGRSFKNYCDDEAINLQANTIYLVPNDLSDAEFYYEFLVVDDGNDIFSEMIGTTQVDLSNYATTSALNEKLNTTLNNDIESGDTVNKILVTVGNANTIKTTTLSSQLEAIVDSLINEAQS